MVNKRFDTRPGQLFIISSAVLSNMYFMISIDRDDRVYYAFVGTDTLSAELREAGPPRIVFYGNELLYDT